MVKTLDIQIPNPGQQKVWYIVSASIVNYFIKLAFDLCGNIILQHSFCERIWNAEVSDIAADFDFKYIWFEG